MIPGPVKLTTKISEYSRKLQDLWLSKKVSIIKNVEILRKMYTFAYIGIPKEIMNLVIPEIGCITEVNCFSSGLNMSQSICLAPLFNICV